MKFWRLICRTPRTTVHIYRNPPTVQLIAHVNAAPAGVENQGAALCLRWDDGKARQVVLIFPRWENLLIVLLPPFRSIWLPADATNQMSVSAFDTAGGITFWEGLVSSLRCWSRLLGQRIWG